MEAQSLSRRELVRLMILKEISDDFEHVDQIIFPHVRDQALQCRLTVDREEVLDALEDLVREGLAKAYRLSPAPDDPTAGELPGMPARERIGWEEWIAFYVTPAGMEAQLADTPLWPFDAEGELCPDWTLPSQP